MSKAKFIISAPVNELTPVVVDLFQNHVSWWDENQFFKYQKAVFEVIAEQYFLPKLRKNVEDALQVAGYDLDDCGELFTYHSTAVPDGLDSSVGSLIIRVNYNPIFLKKLDRINADFLNEYKKKHLSIKTENAKTHLYPEELDNDENVSLLSALQSVNIKFKGMLIKITNEILDDIKKLFGFDIWRVFWLDPIEKYEIAGFVIE